MQKLSIVFIFILITASVYSQNKIPITKAEDLPTHYYNLEDPKAMNYINDIDLCLRLADEIEKNLKNDLEKYDIQDKSTLRDYHDAFATIYFLKGDYAASLMHTKKGRALAEKESRKYLWNLHHEAYLIAKMNGCSDDEEAFKNNLKNYVSVSLQAAPYNAIKEEVESSVGMLDVITENLIQGMIEGETQPILDKAKGNVPQSAALGLLGSKWFYMVQLPYAKNVYHPVYQDIYDQNHVEKEMVDIWKDRDVDFFDETNLHPVTIAVWDSGVDVENFPLMNIWKNAAEKLDGKDNDGNGFVDDINGIAFDMEVNPTMDVLLPAEKINPDIQKYGKYAKGISDLNANIKSEDGDEVKKYLASMQPGEVAPFLENMSLYGNYAHGTHVAGIAAKGNPQGKILAARLSWGYKNLPELPTLEKSKKWAKLYENSIQYFKENNVKVVNMSWAYSAKGYEYALAANGKGETDEERKSMAQELFNIEKEAFYNAMKNAPEILFVTSAGNSNDDLGFSSHIPKGFDLPNLMQIGAVDIEGKETGFTAMGKGVDVYANGYEVESYVPGGAVRKMSGTSMSSPQVANLAGKIWSKYPELNAMQVKELIIKGASPSEHNAEILLINPKKSLELAGSLVSK